MKKSVFPAAVLLLFLWKPAVSLAGAKDGLNLWACVVLPTLLPFMLCSGAVAASGGISLLTAPVRPFLRRIFGFSPAGCYVLLTGLLCGYPMGAKTCADFLSRGMISRQEASVLLAVSNHPSPMFLMGYVMAGMEAVCPPALFLAAVYLPVFPAAFLARKLYEKDGTEKKKKEESLSGEPLPGPSEDGFSFDRDFMSCLETMIRIGGYILAFSILAAYIRELSPLPPQWNACLLGLTEITTGIHALKSALSRPALAGALAFVSSFGGLSGIFQTKSVLEMPERAGQPPAGLTAQKNAGLSIRHYVLWKLFHAGLSCLILTVLLWFLSPGALLPPR
ncbi:MAG TPA: nucleoside recognition protein [Candidatus Lachnoclostridium pullistercoris]|uniref:Nucleoside recognition protein n=1 Tax=Candidatus Lachnoclostridium pullistercoris TaxID=2838632 RepID=A0A9D2PBE3_9FIRM|nr:nucleoside recognition protein [Candidatus Lachnoclostridium pullistercoris]